jgi:uncharacterized Zn-finger protein
LSPTALDGGLNFPPTDTNSPTIQAENFHANSHGQLRENNGTHLPVLVENIASSPLAREVEPRRQGSPQVQRARVQCRRSKNINRFCARKVTGKERSTDDPTCPICGFVSSREKDVRRHMLSRHVGTVRHKCHDCEKSYSRSDNLLRHMNTAHGRQKTWLASMI